MYPPVIRGQIVGFLLEEEMIAGSRLAVQAERRSPESEIFYNHYIGEAVLSHDIFDSSLILKRKS